MIAPKKNKKRDEWACPCCGTPTDSAWCAACEKAECGERDVETFEREGCLVKGRGKLKRFRIVGRIHRDGRDAESGALSMEFITAQSESHAIVAMALREPFWELVSCKEETDETQFYAVTELGRA